MAPANQLPHHLGAGEKLDSWSPLAVYKIRIVVYARSAGNGQRLTVWEASVSGAERPSRCARQLAGGGEKQVYSAGGLLGLGAARGRVGRAPLVTSPRAAPHLPLY